MSYRLVFNELAYDDLDDVFAWVEAEADARTADRYDARLRRSIAALEHFPHRGTPRPKIGPDFRSITFERRRLIIYRVTGDVVEIVRVLHAFQDIDALLGA